MNIKQGQQTSQSLTVTAEKVAACGEVTGDFNPLHFDEEFTSKTRFGRLMAQGGIAVGLIHALVAMDMPGPGTVFMEQHWTFSRPVYVGDIITAEATVTSVREGRPIATMEFVVRNQDGDEVLTGTATVYQAMPTQ